ncbi:Rho GTPase [Pseudohyphozyma bogoriensis]|nr:Rho GTPase [Pseudohyphozyma bogoriensis]
MAPLCGFGGSFDDQHDGGAHAESAAARRTGKPLHRKLVVVGDGGCGKTSLLHVYVQQNFPSVYEPTVFENHVVELVIDDTPLEMSLWDTAGQEDFDRLRSLSYPDSHVVLLCFGVELCAKDPSFKISRMFSKA